MVEPVVIVGLVVACVYVYTFVGGFVWTLFPEDVKFDDRFTGRKISSEGILFAAVWPIAMAVMTLRCLWRWSSIRRIASIGARWHDRRMQAGKVPKATVVKD
jgi:hypothetical protein